MKLLSAPTKPVRKYKRGYTLCTVLDGTSLQELVKYAGTRTLDEVYINIDCGWDDREVTLEHSGLEPESTFNARMDVYADKLAKYNKWKKDNAVAIKTEKAKRSAATKLKKAKAKTRAITQLKRQLARLEKS